MNKKNIVVFGLNSFGMSTIKELSKFLTALYVQKTIIKEVNKKNDCESKCKNLIVFINKSHIGSKITLPG